MANTRPTPVGFLKAVCLVWLVLARPKQFLELQAEDSKALNAVTNPQKEEGALVVRGAFFKSLLLVLLSGAVGYVAGIVLGHATACASANFVSWLQIVGASLLLWEPCSFGVGKSNLRRRYFNRARKPMDLPSFVLRGHGGPCVFTRLATVHEMTANNALLTDAFSSLRCACGAAKRER